MSPPIRDGSGSSIGSIRLGDGTEISEVRTGAGDVLFSGNAIPDSALTQDLVAWYRFEDGDARDYTATFDAQFADSTAYDGTVNGATFQSNGGVTDFENGANSGAFDFAGSSTNSINQPSGVVQTGTSARTTMCWVKVTEETNDRQAVLSWGDDNDGEAWEMEVYYAYDGNVKTGPGAIGVHTWEGGHNSNTGLVSLDEWFHFAATCDGSESSIQLYLNGEPVTTNNTPSGSFNTSDSSPLLGYSSPHGSGEHTFEGLVDDVRVYNRALTDSEISAIHQDTKL